jgi:pimeloyl-ACP methyl ester carboxylesterase
VLILIPAGGADASSYRRLAPLLAPRRTVVSYDRRGYSRSVCENPAAPVDVRTHAEDLSRLIRAVAPGPAGLFGSSAGAVVGLELAIHDPEAISTVVVHEPPLPGLVPLDGGGFEAAGVRPRANGPAFLVTHELPAVARYRFDPAAIRARVIPAGGAASRDFWPYRCAMALAAAFGTKLAEFPGGHAGYVSDPETFAERLLQEIPA